MHGGVGQRAAVAIAEAEAEASPEAVDAALDAMWDDLAPNAIEVIIDGGGSEIADNTKVWIRAPFDCDIVGWSLLGDQSGSAVVDIWKDNFATGSLPDNTDSITAAATPAISTAIAAQSTTLTDWTTSITKGQVLVFNCDSATTITKLTVVLDVLRTREEA